MSFAFKVAGAAAERGDDLDRVAELAQRAVDATRTVGVGLSPTILPAAGKPTFELADGEMEIGIGIHGEPGQHRGPLETADEVGDRLISAILGDLPLDAGDRVAVMVNGMGATPAEELYLIYRRVYGALAAHGVTVHRPYVGEYATSLEMAGASVTACGWTTSSANCSTHPPRRRFSVSEGGLMSAMDLNQVVVVLDSALAALAEQRELLRDLDRGRPASHQRRGVRQGQPLDDGGARWRRSAGRGQGPRGRADVDARGG